MIFSGRMLRFLQFFFYANSILLLGCFSFFLCGTLYLVMLNFLLQLLSLFIHSITLDFWNDNPTSAQRHIRTQTCIQPHPASGSLLLLPDGAISQKPEREQLFSWSHPHCRALTQGETNNLASLPQSQLYEPAGDAPRGWCV